jgi:hypothetical protein
MCRIGQFVWLCSLRDWYTIWDKNPYTAHKARYYSTTLIRWMCINGKALSQQEGAWPEGGVSQFGTENTDCQQLIRTTIEHIRSGTSGKKLVSCSLEPDVNTL